jgi:putative inorganic carbon (hco3(-)) transporter
MLNPARPYFFLLAYVVVLYLRPQEYVPALMGSPLVPVLLLFAAAFWLVAQAKNFEAPQHRLVLGLVAAMFMSVLLTGWFTGAINVVTEFVPTLLLFYLTATSVDSLKRFRDMAIVLTVVTTVIAIHGAEQFASEKGIGWTGAQLIDGRITYLGFLNDPNDLSMAFLMTLPLTLYVAGVSKSFLIRLAFFTAAGAILYGIYLCNSRGSMLGLLVMLLAYATRRYGWLRSVIVGPLLIVPLLLLAPSRVSDMSADEESAAGRIDAWYEGFDMLRSHPLFGVGKGLFTDHNYLTAHNSFVLAIAELGTIGYFFWLAILILSVTMLFRILRFEAPDAEPEAAAAPPAWTGPQLDAPQSEPVAEDALRWDELQRAASALGYAFIGSIVAAFFLSRSYVVFLYLLVALIVAVYQMARTRWPELAPVRFGDMAGKLLIYEVGSIVFLWLLTRVLLVFS